VSRLPYRDRDDLPEEFRPLWDSLESERGYVPGLYRAAANAPGFLRDFLQMGATARQAGRLPQRLKELAILTVARKTQTATMWVSHLPMARAAGLTETEILALPVWRSHSAFTAHERAVIQYAEQVTAQIRVSDETWRAAASRLDDAAMTELVFVVAFYNFVARFLGPSEIELDPRYLEAREG
jgi:alkylhydroperoxidase family enzyme